MKTLTQLQNEVGQWGNETFPVSSVDSILAHFREEVAEFLEVAPTMPTNPQYDEAEEAADVILLLFHFAHKLGFSLEEAIERKMEINRARTWKTTAEAAGHFRHIETEGIA